MKRSTFFATIAFLIGIAGLSLAIIALTTTRWRWDNVTGRQNGLFTSCQIGGTLQCVTAPRRFQPHVQATQAFLIMGCLTSFLGLVANLVNACGKGGKKGHVAAGVLYVLTGIFLLVSCAVYTGATRPLLQSVETFGYSLWLAWASDIIHLLVVPLAFLSKNDKFAYV
uniref:Claudin n=1 Tax=Ciona savignyi TaxID=51511 RepID=H2ZJ80_CIOSA